MCLRTLDARERERERFIFGRSGRVYVCIYIYIYIYMGRVNFAICACVGYKGYARAQRRAGVIMGVCNDANAARRYISGAHCAQGYGVRDKECI